MSDLLKNAGLFSLDGNREVFFQLGKQIADNVIYPYETLTTSSSDKNRHATSQHIIDYIEENEAKDRKDRFGKVAQAVGKLAFDLAEVILIAALTKRVSTVIPASSRLIFQFAKDTLSGEGNLATQASNALLVSTISGSLQGDSFKDDALNATIGLAAGKALGTSLKIGKSLWASPTVKKRRTDFLKYLFGVGYQTEEEIKKANFPIIFPKNEEHYKSVLDMALQEDLSNPEPEEMAIRSTGLDKRGIGPTFPKLIGVFKDNLPNIKPLPIILNRGKLTRPKKARSGGWGWLHIAAAHAQEILQAGFKDEEDYIKYVFNNIHEIRMDPHDSGSAIVSIIYNEARTPESLHHAVFIHQDPTGSYYRAASATPAYEFEHLTKKIKMVPVWGGMPLPAQHPSSTDGLFPTYPLLAAGIGGLTGRAQNDKKSKTKDNLFVKAKNKLASIWSKMPIPSQPPRSSDAPFPTYSLIAAGVSGAYGRAQTDQNNRTKSNDSVKKKINFKPFYVDNAAQEKLRIINEINSMMLEQIEQAQNPERPMHQHYHMSPNNSNASFHNAQQAHDFSNIRPKHKHAFRYSLSPH